MREKKQRLFVTFHTTAAAMAMEKYGAQAGLDGRLMPVPRALSADCGIAWCGRVEQRAQTQALLDARELEYEEVCELLI